MQIEEIFEGVSIMQTVIKFFQDAGVYYLSTIDGDQPRVRPFGAVASHDGKMYFITANTKDVYKQLQANPKLEFCAMANNHWIRVHGIATFDDSRAAKEAMLDQNPDLKAMYNPDDGIMVVFYITEGEATIYSFTEEPKTWKF